MNMRPYETTKMNTLQELAVGQTAVIKTVGGEGALRQHFLDMGVIPGTEVTVTKFAPMGDPMEIRIHGYELTMRLSEAEKIEIETGKEAAATGFDRPGAGQAGKRAAHLQ